MKAVITVIVDIEDEAEIVDVRDLREHLAIEIEKRREIRRVEDTRVTLLLGKESP